MCSTPTVPAGSATESTFNLEFPYRRSAGPIVGAFLTALKERRLVGVRSPTSGVLCPPLEYDPQTAAELTELVDLPATGTVQEFAWVSAPLRKHPLDRPFAWALIQIDGADTRMLHAVDAGSRDAIRRGLRVKARWAGETKGHMSDLACFVPDDGHG
jgi:uncharacterized OB-fold protein